MRALVKKWVYRTRGGALTGDAWEKALTFGVTYHRFEEKPGGDPNSGVAITPERFKRHLDVLGNIGEWVTIDEAREPGDKIRFFLCFDDGYEDNATILPGLLKEVPACLFVTTGWIQGAPEKLAHDRRDGYPQPPMSEAQLKTLGEDPRITLGSHTVSHPRLSELGSEAFEREVKDSKAWLEKTVGKPVDHLAIPFGQPEDFPWERDIPYKTILSNYGGANGADRLDDRGDLRHLRRVPAPNTDDPDVLVGWVMGLCNLAEHRHPVRRLS